jgi:hypothetical protein
MSNEPNQPPKVGGDTGIDVRYCIADGLQRAEDIILMQAQSYLTASKEHLRNDELRSRFLANYSAALSTLFPIRQLREELFEQAQKAGKEVDF